MSNEQDQSEDLAAVELENVKARAELLGVSFHPSISAAKLREKIAAHVAAQEAGETVKPKAEAKDEPVELTEGQIRKRAQLDALKLVRIRLTCMNPAKKEWDGEIITAGNAVVGTVKKYIPFNAEEGWHVPHIILEVLRERQFQTFVTDKSARGISVRRGKILREFAIEVLDPLTAGELDELKQRQAMAHSID